MNNEIEKKENPSFFTPELFAQEQFKRLESPRGKLLIASCCSGSYLAKRVVKAYNNLLKDAGSKDQVLFLGNIDKHFSDQETCVRLDYHVGGYDVYLFQALYDPTSNLTIDQNYIAFLIAARTLREHGAKQVVGVLPYLAYSRQDKPTKFRREPTTARLMADLSIEAGIDRLIAWEPHSSQIRGFYGKVPTNMLESLSLFVDEFKKFEKREDVIAVAPDVGASKYVTHFSKALNINSAISAKERPAPENVVIKEIIGDFRGKSIAIVLDDMISNGGTIEALLRKLKEETEIKDVYLGVSHNLCVGPALKRLKIMHNRYNLKKVIVTNSIPQTDEFKSLPFVKVHCLSEPLVRTINRIHYDRSVSEVFYRE